MGLADVTLHFDSLSESLHAVALELGYKDAYKVYYACLANVKMRHSIFKIDRCHDGTNFILGKVNLNKLMGTLNSLQDMACIVALSHCLAARFSLAWFIQPKLLIAFVACLATGDSKLPNNIHSSFIVTLHGLSFKNAINPQANPLRFRPRRRRTNMLFPIREHCTHRSPLLPKQQR
jgi:hypothetical protein